MGNQEDFGNAKEEAIDEEEAGLDQWQAFIPSLFPLE